MEDLTIKAFNLLLGNKKQGYSRHLKRNYLYCSPDAVHYHQWFWDSCFHAIVMADLKVKLAIKEIETLLSCQTDNGFVPHIIFWKWRLIDIVHYFKAWKKELHPAYKFFTAEIQPPVIGITLEKIYNTTRSIVLLQKYLPLVGKYFDYLARERDRDGNSLISIITPMESGMDMAPHFDLVLGNAEHNPAVTKGKISEMLSEYRNAQWNLDDIYELDIFNFEDVAVNTIYCLSLEKLAGLWELIDTKKSNEIRQLHVRVKQAILEKLWDADDRIFYGRYHKGGKEYVVKIKTVASLFPLCLDIPEEYASSLVQHLCNEDEFWLTYPVPSVARNEKSFGPLANTRYIWRGTTWINTNWFLAKGLLRHGNTAVYEKLKQRTLELIEKYGFCEYYDPFTGHPGQAMRKYGWSTLAVDM